MNVLGATVALRERPLLDVVDLAVRFCARHARPYAIVSAWTLLPAFFVTWAIAVRYGPSSGWLATFAFAALAQSPFTVLASRLVFEPTVRVRDVFASAARATPRIAVVRALQLAALTIGFTFFMLPAVWVAVLSLFLSEVIVLEHASPRVAAARVQRLSRGHFGDGLVGLLFLVTLHIVVVLVGDLAGRAVLSELLEITPPPSLVEARWSALALSAFWLYLPFGVTCRFFLYLNVRTRSEGWDIQTRFAALAARASREAPSGAVDPPRVAP